MTSTESVDPFVQALSAELDALHTGMPENMDPDTRVLHAIARSLLRREQEIADNEAWVVARNATLRREIESIWAFKCSEAMGCVRRLKHGKSRSVTVPGMRFGLRAAKASIRWAPEDKDALIAWAKEHCPVAVTVTAPDPRESLTKTELVGYVKVSGRVPPGCTYRSEGDEPYARPLKHKDEVAEHGDESSDSAPS